jgi:hypothetical protein
MASTTAPQHAGRIRVDGVWFGLHFAKLLDTFRLSSVYICLVSSDVVHVSLALDQSRVSHSIWSARWLPMSAAHQVDRYRLARSNSLGRRCLALIKRPGAAPSPH